MKNNFIASRLIFFLLFILIVKSFCNDNYEQDCTIGSNGQDSCGLSKKTILRKAVPIIGLKSSGKTFFIDSLFGLNIFDESTGPSKFICIFQHHPGLKVPKFYQISMSEFKNQYSGEIEYFGIPKGSITSGIENIKKKVLDLNKNEFPENFEDLFYVLEIEIKNIKNQELLNNYDFYDIPGVNQYIKNNRNDFFKNVFKYFKKKIYFGIIIIDSEDYYKDETKNIFINTADIISPLKIENFLIVFNKIDKLKNPKDRAMDFKAKLVNMMDIFIFNDNIFIPLDSRELRYSNNMDKNFNDFIQLLFNKYVSISVIPYKDGYKGQNPEYNTNRYSFYDFLSKDFINKLPQVENKESNFIEEFESQYKDKELLPEFEKIYKQIDEFSKDYEINLDLDIEDENTINLFKELYMIFKKKLYSLNSDNIKNLFNYFEQILKNLKKTKTEEKPIQNLQNSFIQEFSNFSNHFNKFSYKYNKTFEILNLLSDDIESLYNYITNQQILYVGIFGGSSTGKSAIFNNILGEDILTIKDNECTRRGIIIEDGEKIEIFKVNSSVVKSRESNFFIFERTKKLASGKEKVKEILELLNEDYSENNNEYFVLTIPIRFFDEIKLDKDLRKYIKFIDIPGYNTEKSKKFPFNPLIESISCFLITLRSDKINFNNNTVIWRIFESLKSKSKRAINTKEDFVNLCLFVVNLFDKKELNEKKRREIINEINEIFPDIDNKDLKVTFFNADNYKKYLEKEKYYSDYEFLFEKTFEKYNERSIIEIVFNWWTGKKFIEFFIDSFQKDFKKDFKIKIKEKISK